MSDEESYYKFENNGAADEIDKYFEVTEDLLIENDHLFQKIQEIDLHRLTLYGFFDKIVNELVSVNG